jgi:hypothetical protein
MTGSVLRLEAEIRRLCAENEGHLEAIKALSSRLDEYRASNAELVAALEALVRYDRDPGRYPEDYGTKLLKRADAAIAAAKGEE